jgi:hypothetical protein
MLLISLRISGDHMLCCDMLLLALDQDSFIYETAKGTFETFFKEPDTESGRGDSYGVGLNYCPFCGTKLTEGA